MSGNNYIDGLNVNKLLHSKPLKYIYEYFLVKICLFTPDGRQICGLGCSQTRPRVGKGLDPRRADQNGAGEDGPAQREGGTRSFAGADGTK